MSTYITTAFVQQYKANVELLSQQMGSRIQRAVRVESQEGEYAWYEQIAATAAAQKTGRHEETDAAFVDTGHESVRVGIVDYSWVDYIDREDRVRMLIDPTSPYAQNAAAAFGVTIDTIILSAALGNAFRAANVTKDNVATVALPAGQIIAAGTTNMTIAKLIEAKGKFWAADVREDMPKFIACTGNQLESLLGTTEVASADYNTVKALVRGEINTFMGFEFIRVEDPILTKTVNTRHCVAWCMDGLLLALGIDINARIGERADKQYLTQVFTQMTIGATRMEEVKVVQIDCDETAQ